MNTSAFGGWTPSADQEKIIEKEYATMRDDAKKSANALTLENGSLWIDTAKYLPCRMEGLMKFDSSGISSSFENVSTKFSVTYSNFNEVLAVSTPDKSISVEEFGAIAMQILMSQQPSSSAMLGGDSLPTPTNRVDTDRISDLRKIQVFLEMYFKEYGHYPYAMSGGQAIDGSLSWSQLGLQLNKFYSNGEL
jgi:hypothetical protein